jgi:hypothetical protein
MHWLSFHLKVAECNSFMEEVKLEKEMQQKVCCLHASSETEIYCMVAWYDVFLCRWMRRLTKQLRKKEAAGSKSTRCQTSLIKPFVPKRY